MAFKLSHFDANMTDGTDPNKMDAVYEIIGTSGLARAKIAKMITLSLSKPSIIADGSDFATLSITSSKNKITVVLTQDRESAQVDVPLTAGVGTLDITSDFAGKIQIDCTDLCETIYLGVQ